MDNTQTQPVENSLLKEEAVIEQRSPLTLDIREQEAVTTINSWIKTSRTFFEKKYNLYERRKKNETFLFGRQVEERDKLKKLKDYESRYLDNVLYEIEASLKPLAMSRLPDMIVTPGNDTPESLKTSEDVSKVIDTDIKKRQNRQVLGIAFKHHPVYFTGIIKCRWDPEKEDYIFEVIHPDQIDVDHTCHTKDANDMSFVSQILPMTVQMAIMRFPDKKDDLMAQLQLDGVMVGADVEPKNKGLLTEIQIREIWYDWYEKKDEEWEKLSCVMWKYKDVVLKNIKNPNFDYEGYTNFFDTNPENNTKRKVSAEEMQMFAMTGQLPPTVSQEQIYRNYFDSPQKPYFFFGYDQWRKMPYDETSRIEQNIRNQENLDRTGKSVMDKLSSRIKHIFSRKGGLKAEDIEQMDMDDPRQDILVDGDVREVHGAIVPEQPTSQEFNELSETRHRMYGLAGSNAVRGEVLSQTATSNQIAREADFTRADDLVEDTIAEASEWMARWAMHMIKLRYTEDHFRKLSGKRGQTTFVKLNRDMIEDGMEVQIKSSGTDKMMVKKTAMDLAAAKMIDPCTLFRDMGLSDPEGRTEDLIMSQTDPASYLAKIKGLGSTTPELVSSLMGSAGGQNINTMPPAPLSPSTTATQVQAPDNNSLPVAPPSTPPMGSPRGL